MNTFYSTIRRMTRMFCAGIACITLSILCLRLTVFSDMATVTPVSSAASLVTTDEQADGIPFQINGKITFSSADSKGNVLIKNPETNDYIINVNIVLKETGDSLLSTGFIHPGITVDKLKMDPPGQLLDDGVYECVAEITAYDAETLKSIGAAETDVQIYVGVKPGK